MNKSKIVLAIIICYFISVLLITAVWIINPFDKQKDESNEPFAHPTTEFMFYYNIKKSDKKNLSGEYTRDVINSIISFNYVFDNYNCEFISIEFNGFQKESAQFSGHITDSGHNGYELKKHSTSGIIGNSSEANCTKSYMEHTRSDMIELETIVDQNKYYYIELGYSERRFKKSNERVINFVRITELEKKVNEKSISNSIKMKNLSQRSRAIKNLDILDILNEIIMYNESNMNNPDKIITVSFQNTKDQSKSLLIYNKPINDNNIQNYIQTQEEYITNLKYSLKTEYLYDGMISAELDQERKFNKS